MLPGRCSGPIRNNTSRNAVIISHVNPFQESVRRNSCGGNGRATEAQTTYPAAPAGQIAQHSNGKAKGADDSIMGVRQGGQLWCRVAVLTGANDQQLTVVRW